MKAFLKSLIAVAAVAAVPLFAVPTATLRIMEGATCNLGVNCIDILDNSGLDAFSTVLGRVSYTTGAGGLFGLGGWDVTIGNGSTKLDSGGAADPTMSLDMKVKRRNNLAGTLTFLFSDVGFTAVPLFSDFTSQVGQSGTNGTGRLSAYLSAGNSLFAQTTTVADSGNMNWGGLNPHTQAYEDLGITTFSATPYSLTLKQVVTFNANQKNKFVSSGSSLSPSAVPEPGFYGALAVGLSGLFALVARRRKSSNV